MNVNSKPLGHSQPFHSFENVLGDKDTFRALAGENKVQDLKEVVEASARCVDIVRF